MRISEVSPNTLAGSFSDDLVISKIWLIKHLNRIRSEYSTIYVLGSWFGNLALLMAARDLRFDRIVNIDLDADAVSIGDELIEKMGLSGKIESIRMDANHLSYEDLDDRGLVVNTSCNNIDGNAWFDNIPSGVLVALQGRNNDPGARIKQNSISDLSSTYPMQKVMFSGQITLEDRDGSYDRYMIIGEK